MNTHDDPEGAAANLRQRSEDHFQHTADPLSEQVAAMSPDEIQRTLHELRVHQIELEMQNEELRRAQIELDLARDRYFDLFDMAPVGYCTLTTSGSIQEANLTAASLLGVVRSTLIGHPFASFICAEDQDRFHLLRRNLLQTGVPGTCDLKMVRKGQESFWARLETSLTLDAEESPLCRVVISDASERKSAELTLCSALSQAEAANQAKSLFLSTMSHEIRTPLNGIIGLTDMLMRASLPPAQARMVKVVQDCGHSLMSVIGEVLDLAKIESGKLELESSDFDVHRLIEEIRGLFAVSTLIKGLSLAVSVDPAVPVRLRGDPGRLRQVLINLLGNAVKFTEHGAVTLSVAATIDVPDRVSLTCAVSDTGPGIPMAYLPRIFEPFSQADTSMTRRHGGSGLGLTIAKRLADLMDGTLTVESRIGQGSRFSLALPMRIGNAPTAVPIAAEPVSCKVLKRPLTVLVVEDDPTCQFTLQLMLDGLGCRARLVENGRLAIAAVKEGGFDLVLMDCQMPICDGYAATRAIRKLSVAMAPRRLPIIALTANAFSEDRETCQAAGMDDVLTKPCNQEDLKACLVKWAGEMKSGAQP
jgi:PAS domain S-box-containing protein